MLIRPFRCLKRGDIKALVQKTVATYGQLDFAFNNAGVESPGKLLHEQSIEEFDNLMAINVRGLFLSMKYEIEQMLTQGSGAIVNTSSIVGLIGLPGASPYVAMPDVLPTDWSGVVIEPEF